MNEILNANRKPIILLGITMGFIYLIYLIITRFLFAFSQQVKQYEELLILPFDFMLALPAFLGIYYFYKNNKTNNWLVPLTYFIYGLTILAGMVSIFIAGSALSAGLLLTMVVGPIAFCVSLFLIITWFKEKNK